MRPVLAGVLVAALIVACAAPQRADVGFGKRDEILTLWSQIRDWRARSGLRVEPSPSNVNAYAQQPVAEAKRVCPDDHVVPKTCDDVCGLSDAICDNSERICKLADELGKDDRFAQDKCASSKASCHEAKQRCCACSEDSPSSEAAGAGAPK